MLREKPHKDVFHLFIGGKDENYSDKSGFIINQQSYKSSFLGFLKPT